MKKISQPRNRKVPLFFHKRHSSAHQSDYLSFSSRNPLDSTASLAKKFFNEESTQELNQRSERAFMSQRAFQRKPRWELLERLESYELKAKRKHPYLRSPNTLVESFQLWEECYTDVLSLIKHEDSDLYNVLSRLNANVFGIFYDLRDMYRKQSKQLKSTVFHFEQHSQVLQKKIHELQDNSEALVKQKELEEIQIKKDIEDIFGPEINLEALKKNSQNLQDIDTSETVSILKALYDELSKDRILPKAKTLEVDYLDPDELKDGILKKYALIQKNTAGRVLKMLDNRTDKSEKETQTFDELILKEEYDRVVLSEEHTKKLYFSLHAEYEKQLKENTAKDSELKKLKKEMTDLSSLHDSYGKEIEKFKKQRWSLDLEIQRISEENEGLYIKIKESGKENKDLKKQMEAQTEEYFQAKALLMNELNSLREFKEKAPVGSRQSSRISQMQHERAKTKSSESNMSFKNKNEEMPNTVKQKIPEKTEKAPKKVKEVEEPSVDTPRPPKIDTSPKLESKEAGSSITNLMKEEELSPLHPNISMKKNVSVHIKARKKSMKFTKLRREKATEDEIKSTLKISQCVGEDPISLMDVEKNYDGYSVGVNRYKKGEQGHLVEVINKGAWTTPEIDLKYAINLQQIPKSQDIIEEMSFEENTGKHQNPGNTREIGNSPGINEKPEMKSVGVNYNYLEPDKVYDSPRQLYLLPYNPNIVFGLQGDMFYKGKVFHAQPKIPDLQDSLTFKQKY